MSNRNKGSNGSYNGVQWLDISQSMEEFQSQHGNLKSMVCLEPNGLGVFTLEVKLFYKIGSEVHLAVTEEPWSPSKGRLEAFTYRSVIDTMKEVDYQLAKAAKDKAS